jgi:predicted RNA-binding Zn ribbon-like protein
MSTFKLVRIKAVAPNPILRDFVVTPRRDFAVDFANTLAWRGSEPSESLHHVGDLISWLRANNALGERASSELEKWTNAHPAKAVILFGEALELREAVYRLLRAIVTNSAPGEEDLSRLNRALSEVAPRAKLWRSEGGFGWRIESSPTASVVLAPVLWSAANLLLTADPSRMRQCANARCLWLFQDDSKNGSRRWCSMQACGNRAKAHRHYLRQKAK